MPLLSLQNVSLSLGQNMARVEILKNLSLSIEHRETVGLVGHSGSGKSTALMIMAGLERADKGTIHYEDKPLHQLSEDELAVFRAENIGIVFQSFHLLPALTALENVALPLELLGVKDAEKRALEKLTAVGLSARKAHYPAQMSGGEQQRVAIARAFVARPKLILADEPTGNLDEKTGEIITKLMFERIKETKATLVLVTHDLDLAHKCDRTIRLRLGEIESE